MAIVTKSLFKGSVVCNNSEVDIYQVPVDKRALIKNFMFYNTIIGAEVGEDGFILITDSGDVELVRIWWNTDMNGESVAASSSDFIQVVGGVGDAGGLENIVLENRMKIRMNSEDLTGFDWTIRAEVSGAEEDV